MAAAGLKQPRLHVPDEPEGTLVHAVPVADGHGLFTIVGLAFVPFLLNWNLLGLRW